MPLSDILVVELASVLAGPSAGQYLAELGAAVIKVENASGGDVTRSWRIASEHVASDRTAYFASCNWGKRSIAVDLSDPRGKAIVHGLVRKADVVLDSYKPGAAARLGVDADRLCALNKSLVHVGISGYGADDQRAGYDAAIQAESGFMFINGQTDGPPTKMPVALVDLLAGHHVREAVLVGLLRREKSGIGNRTDISLFEAAVSSLANQASGFLQSGVEPGRIGSAHPSIVPYGTPFRTRDHGWLTLAVGTDKQFQRLVSLLGLSAHLGGEAFSTNQRRVEARDTVEQILADSIRNFETKDLVHRLNEASIPCSPVAPVSESLSTALGRGMVLADGEGLERVAAVRQSIGNPVEGLRPPPHFGEHTKELLQEFLGFAPEEVAVLVADGVVRQF